MSIDRFYAKRYNKTNYNCAHFVTEVWEHVTGDNIAHIMRGFLLPAESRNVRIDLRKSFVRLEKPIAPCIVLMQRKANTPHVGIYIYGRVFHITEKGVELQPLDLVTLPFTRVGFYQCLKP